MTLKNNGMAAENSAVIIGKKYILKYSEKEINYFKL